MPASPLPLGELGTDPFGASLGGTNKPAGVPAASISTTSPVLDPYNNPSPYTVLVAQGQTSPGYIETGGVTGFERSHKWDKKSGKGTTGATTTYVGLEPAEGAITFSLPTVAAVAAWASYLALFRFDTAKGKGEAVTVYHPGLASVQPPIVSVVMTGHTRVEADDKGLAKVTIKLLEYFEAKATGATTAAGSKQYVQVGGASGKQEDPAIKKLQQQAQQLQKQLQATA